MRVVDVTGQACPIPVIEVKKALAGDGVRGVVARVDNVVAVQNLEKMAKGYGYGFSYTKGADGCYDVVIERGGGGRGADYGNGTDSGGVGSGVNGESAAGGLGSADTGGLGSADTGGLGSAGAGGLGGGESGAYKISDAVDESVAHSDMRRGNELENSTGARVFVFSRDALGEGDEALGRVLIKGFIYALSELDDAPDTMIFLNSGAFLTDEDATTLDDLRKLVDKGTKVLTCGTCVDYFGLRPDVGEVTDMYGIAAKIMGADRVVVI